MHRISCLAYDLVYHGYLCDVSKTPHYEQRQSQNSEEKRYSEKVDGSPEESKGMVS